jgi:type II secretory pathway pseudopilin PulG
MKLHRAIQSRKKTAQAGMSLIETVVALGLLLIVAAGVMSLAGVAMSTTENQGHLGARTAEYAQDKMEQLLALNFQDQCTDTTVYPAVINCGVGLGLAVGGGLNPNAPVAGYVDYVDISGNPVASTANWQYIRLWQITANATNDLKTITVFTQVRAGVGQPANLPRTTVACLKSKPF